MKTSKLPRLVISGLLIVALSLMPVSAQQEPPPDPETQMLACGPLCIIGIAVVVVGGYVAYRLIKFCKRHLPTTSPPPPPNQGTNAPAMMRLTSVESLRLLEMDDAAVDLIDVAAFGWKDGSGQTYSDIAATELQSAPTPGGPWQKEMTVTSWVSPANVLSVYYDRLGQCIATNYCPATTNTSELGAIPELPATPDPARYFRLALPQ